MQKVQHVNITSMPVEKPTTKAQPKQTKQDQIMAALNELKADVDGLKKGSQNPERGSQNPERETPQLKTKKLRHMCKSCEDLKSEKYNHYFFCGSTDHFSYGFRRK